MPSHLKLIILGPPCGGKSSQAYLLSELYGLELFDIDALVHQHLDGHTPLGIEVIWNSVRFPYNIAAQIEQLLQQGRSIPSSLYCKILLQAFEKVLKPNNFPKDQYACEKYAISCFVCLHQWQGLGYWRFSSYGRRSDFYYQRWNNPRCSSSSTRWYTGVKLRMIWLHSDTEGDLLRKRSAVVKGVQHYPLEGMVETYTENLEHLCSHFNNAIKTKSSHLPRYVRVSHSH